MPATYRGLVTQRALAATLAGAQASGLDTRRLNLPDAVDANTLRNVLMDASQQAGLPADTADKVMGAAADATRRSDYGVPRGSRNPSNPGGWVKFDAPNRDDFKRPDGSVDSEAWYAAFERAADAAAVPPPVSPTRVAYPKTGYRSIRTKKGGEQLSFLNPNNPPSALWSAVIVGGVVIGAYAWHAKHRHYTPVGAPVQGPADSVPVDVAAIVHAYLRGHGITTDNVMILSPVGPPWHVSASYWQPDATGEGHTLQTIDLIVSRGMWGWKVDLNQ